MTTARADAAHLWITLDAAALNRARTGERFSFTATVVAYVRADGRAGVTLGNVWIG